MAALTLHRWVFSWLRRWFPRRGKARRKAVRVRVRLAKPTLEFLEQRSAPTAVAAALTLPITPPYISHLNRDMIFSSSAGT